MTYINISIILLLASWALAEAPPPPQQQQQKKPHELPWIKADEENISADMRDTGEAQSNLTAWIQEQKHLNFDYEITFLPCNETNRKDHGVKPVSGYYEASKDIGEQITGYIGIITGQKQDTLPEAPEKFCHDITAPEGHDGYCGLEFTPKGKFSGTPILMLTYNSDCGKNRENNNNLVKLRYGQPPLWTKSGLLDFSITTMKAGVDFEPQINLAPGYHDFTQLTKKYRMPAVPLKKGTIQPGSLSLIKTAMRAINDAFETEKNYKEGEKHVHWWGNTTFGESKALRLMFGLAAVAADNKTQSE